MTDPIRVEMYSRPGCHLCDEAKEVVERVRQKFPFSFRIINVEDDSRLESEYGSEIPVILINGIKAFKYHVDQSQLEKKVKTLWKM